MEKKKRKGKRIIYSDFNGKKEKKKEEDNLFRIGFQYWIIFRWLRISLFPSFDKLFFLLITENLLQSIFDHWPIRPYAMSKCGLGPGPVDLICLSTYGQCWLLVTNKIITC